MRDRDEADEPDLERQTDSIHYHPVRHKSVYRARDWPWPPADERTLSD